MPLPDGKLHVELRGLGVHDPTTGEIRSSSIDDIACWFIDTDYNVKVVNHCGNEVLKVYECLSIAQGSP